MCWMTWDQAKVPFSKELLNYINNINILEDMNRLSQCIKLRDVLYTNIEMLEEFQNKQYCPQKVCRE